MLKQVIGRSYSITEKHMGKRVTLWDPKRKSIEFESLLTESEINLILAKATLMPLNALSHDRPV